MMISMVGPVSRRIQIFSGALLGATVLFSTCTPLHEGKMCMRETQPVACPHAIQDVKNKITCSDGKQIVLTDIWEIGKKTDVLTLFCKNGSSAYGVRLDIAGKSKHG
ncbi:MAG: hypothetical protein PHF60_05700, partial [Candidatus ainarchaeum sp.]|nr:hypothetical protein [Candidatus ainarchaeum sp.]